MEKGNCMSEEFKLAFRRREEYFKTQLCARFQAGSCTYGSKCAFAHGVGELRTRRSNIVSNYGAYCKFPISIPEKLSRDVNDNVTMKPGFNDGARSATSGFGKEPRSGKRLIMAGIYADWIEDLPLGNTSSSL